MIWQDSVQLGLFLGILGAGCPFLGRFIHRVLEGQRTFLHPIFAPVERAIYALSGIDPAREQTWGRYALCLTGFSAAGFVLTFGALLLQDRLPLNPRSRLAEYPGGHLDTPLEAADDLMAWVPQVLAG